MISITYKINAQINPHKVGLCYKMSIIGIKRPMCFGYVDELTRRLAINQTVRLSTEGYALAVPGLYGGA